MFRREISPQSSVSKIRQAINWREADSKQNLLHCGFFLGLFFDREDGGDMFLPNVG
jgi:hypothetical protein